MLYEFREKGGITDIPLIASELKEKTGEIERDKDKDGAGAGDEAGA